MRTYVSVPVISHDHKVLGTLCGASGKAIDLSPEALPVMEMFANLIAEQWQRDETSRGFEVRAKKTEALFVERTMFLAQAEHQLKTPLTIVRGWAEMLEDCWQRCLTS